MAPRKSSCSANGTSFSSGRLISKYSSITWKSPSVRGIALPALRPACCSASNSLRAYSSRYSAPKARPSGPAHSSIGSPEMLRPATFCEVNVVSRPGALMYLAASADMTPAPKMLAGTQPCSARIGAGADRFGQVAVAVDVVQIRDRIQRVLEVEHVDLAARGLCFLGLAVGVERLVVPGVVQEAALHATHEPEGVAVGHVAAVADLRHSAGEVDVSQAVAVAVDRVGHLFERRVGIPVDIAELRVPEE